MTPVDVRTLAAAISPSPEAVSSALAYVERAKLADWERSFLYDILWNNDGTYRPSPDTLDMILQHNGLPAHVSSARCMLANHVALAAVGW